MNRSEVTIVIPTLDEAEAIASVINGFKEQGFSNIIVIDGHSRDGTPRIAKECGVQVLLQNGQGKGAAIKHVRQAIETPYTVIVDGDGTYDPKDIDKILLPFEEEADHVIGYRATLDIFTISHKYGNALGNRFFSRGFGVEMKDILSGYRALKTVKLNEMLLKGDGFTVEAEMVIQSLKHHHHMVEVPVTYHERTGKSKLTLRDDKEILLLIYDLFKTTNPMFYFTIPGTIFFIFGLFFGLYVLYERYVHNITHYLGVNAIVLFTLGGLILFSIGKGAEVIITYLEEQKQL